MRRKRLKEAGIGLLFGIPALLIAGSVRSEVQGTEGLVLGLTLLTAFLAGGYLCLSRLRQDE